MDPLMELHNRRTRCIALAIKFAFTAHIRTINCFELTEFLRRYWQLYNLYYNGISLSEYGIFDRELSKLRMNYFNKILGKPPTQIFTDITQAVITLNSPLLDQNYRSCYERCGPNESYYHIGGFAVAYDDISKIPHAFVKRSNMLCFDSTVIQAYEALKHNISVLLRWNDFHYHKIN